jgi:bifunctional non-homologous end joining protein LigD
VPRIKMPGLIKPQLATLKPKAPSRGDWLHEIKYDGYRVQIHELVMVSRCSSTQQN